MRLISLSHSRAAASTASGEPARLRASRNVAWAHFLLESDVARVGGRGRLLGSRDVGVVGPLGGPERVVGHADAGPGVDRDLAALVRDLADLAARTVYGHRDERGGPARAGCAGVLADDGLGRRARP